MVYVPFPVAIRNVYEGSPESLSVDTPRFNIPERSLLLSYFYDSTISALKFLSGSSLRGRTVETRLQGLGWGWGLCSQGWGESTRWPFVPCAALMQTPACHL